MRSIVLLERILQPCKQRSDSAILIFQRQLRTQSNKNYGPVSTARRISSVTGPTFFSLHSQTVRAFATPANAATAATVETGAACATTIPRPRLSPLPYIYLKDLPYSRSSELQELLVNRQIRLRREREDQRRVAISDQGDAVSTSLPVEDGATDLLLLVEHTPTYTNGRRNRGAQAIGDTEASRLQNLGATYVESLRGGEITFHGPGQLVAYPILDLKPIKLSVRCYVSYLEKAIIATCAEWGVKAITTENTGVWIDEQKKIAAIGVHVQRYITSHGLALNCNTNLDFFKEIVACGLTGKETTSLSKELDNPLMDVQKVIPSFLHGFGSTFNRSVVPLAKVNSELEKSIRNYIQTGDAALLK